MFISLATTGNNLLAIFGQEGHRNGTDTTGGACHMTGPSFGDAPICSSF